MKIFVVSNPLGVLGAFYQDDNAKALHKEMDDAVMADPDYDDWDRPQITEVEVSDYTEPPQEWP